MAKDRAGSTGQLWHVLQMVQCRLLSEVSLTSVLSRSITVSSLVGCESVEGGAPPDEGSPVCEETDKDREWGHVTIWGSLYRSWPHTAACEQEDTGQERRVVCFRLGKIGRACTQGIIPKTDYTEQYKYFELANLCLSGQVLATPCIVFMVGV